MNSYDSNESFHVAAVVYWREKEKREKGRGNISYSSRIMRERFSSFHEVSFVQEGIIIFHAHLYDNCLLVKIEIA